jgi:hypothetical protein
MEWNYESTHIQDQKIYPRRIGILLPEKKIWSHSMGPNFLFQQYNSNLPWIDSCMYQSMTLPTCMRTMSCHIIILHFFSNIFIIYTLYKFIFTKVWPYFYICNTHLVCHYVSHVRLTTLSRTMFHMWYHWDYHYMFFTWLLLFSLLFTLTQFHIWIPHWITCKLTGFLILLLFWLCSHMWTHAVSYVKLLTVLYSH